MCRLHDSFRVAVGPGERLLFHGHDAEVAPADAEIMERFEQQLRVPLPTALAVLKDSKNKIKLKVPITGDITDPTFNFTDAFNQALVKGMTKAQVLEATQAVWHPDQMSILAVGDAGFKKKCLGKMGDVAEAGRAPRRKVVRKG